MITNTVTNTVCNPTQAAFSAVRGANGVWTLTHGMTYADSWFWDLGPLGLKYDETPADFSFPDTGTYTLKLITGNACSSDTAVVTVHETGTNRLDAELSDGISLQPNPVSGVAHIRLADAQVREVRLTDMAGRLIQVIPVKQGEAIFVRGDLPAGVYYLRAVQTDGQPAGIRMIVD